MFGRLDPILLRQRRPPLLLGVLALAAGVGLATAAIFALKHIAPVVSLSVVYLLAVLAVSTYWGAGLGVATAVASALAFNLFFLEPVGRFMVSDSRNWVALLTFLTVALVTSTMAEAARARAIEADERRREADLGAQMARTILGGPRLAESLALTSRRLSEVLGAASVSIELDDVPDDARRSSIPLMDGDERIGTLLLPADLAGHQAARVRQRIVPALESILAAALARERLQSEVVETAALRRSDDMKTAVLRSVSHDLRTPVTSVLAGIVALQSASVTEPERRELEADIAGAARRLSLLIDKLLDLARLQAGTAPPHPMWCSVDEVLHEAAAHLAPGNSPFKFSIDPDLPLVRADAVQLDRAFANLLENASRYGGGMPVSVRARAVGHRLMVRIVDRGPGIPRYEQDRIFTPFYRAEGAAQSAGGSGLGLAIAKGFIEANGGRIAVESFPGQGATFVIELPIEAVEQPAPDAPGTVLPA
jgi:two-component system sensor histidine kinase KdpD